MSPANTKLITFSGIWPSHAMNGATPPAPGTPSAFALPAIITS